MELDNEKNHVEFQRHLDRYIANNGVPLILLCAIKNQNLYSSFKNYAYQNGVIT